MIGVVTGIRDLSRASERAVDRAIAEALERDLDEMRFGGARGTDTVALRAAFAWRQVRGSAKPLLRVYVPGRLIEQPAEARAVADRCADAVVGLGLPLQHASSYLDRNEAMLEGADTLLAFTDGRMQGGTAWTLQRAAERGMEVVTVSVRAAQQGASRRRQGRARR